MLWHLWSWFTLELLRIRLIKPWCLRLNFGMLSNGNGLFETLRGGEWAMVSTRKLMFRERVWDIRRTNRSTRNSVFFPSIRRMYETKRSSSYQLCKYFFRNFYRYRTHICIWFDYVQTIQFITMLFDTRWSKLIIVGIKFIPYDVFS